MEVRIATRHTDTTSLRRKFETRNVNQHQLSGPSNSWKTLSRILDLNLGRVSTIFWEDVFKLWNISFWVTSNFRERPSSKLSIEQTIKSRPKRIGKKLKKAPALCMQKTSKQLMKVLHAVSTQYKTMKKGSQCRSRDFLAGSKIERKFLARLNEDWRNSPRTQSEGLGFKGSSPVEICIPRV